MSLRTHKAVEPVASWLWPALLCLVVVSLVRLVEEADQLVVGVLGALLIGCAVALRERRLWTLCLTDSLTGLANRRGFLLRYEKDLVRVRKDGHSMALMLVDCDRFKQLNDQYGHAAGDRALELLSMSLQASVRSGDVVARWGGDEFVVLLRDVDEAEVRRVAARVCHALQAPAALPQGQVITVSFGCVVRDPEQVLTVRLSGLLSAADSAMYLAKRRGGAQLAAWSDASLQQVNPFDFDQLTPPVQTG